MSRRRTPDNQGVDPMSARLAGAFKQISDYRRAPSVRRATNAVIRAGRIAEQARQRKEAAMALSEPEQRILKAICECGKIMIPSDGVAKAICEQLTARRLLRTQSFVDGNSIVGQATVGTGYVATPAGRAAVLP